jgi:hypothetical protein
LVVKAPLSFVNDDNPTLDGHRLEELLVDHVPSPVAWGLEEVVRDMMGTETDETPTMQAWREPGPYFNIGGFRTRA